MAKKVTKIKDISGVNAELLAKQSPAPTGEQETKAVRAATLPASAQRHVRGQPLNIDQILAEAEAQAEVDSQRESVPLSNSERADIVQDVFKEAAEGGEPHVHFSYQNEVYECELLVIESNDILEKTQVAAGNEREQKWLSRFTLQPLIAKITKTGQIYPALAFRDQDGIIWIVDGSRRRMACHYAGQPYMVYVSNKPIPEALITLLSEDTNEHKAPSLIERGRKWARELDALRQDDPKLTVNMFAKRRGLNKDIASAGIRGAALPDFLLDHFPSPPDLGRTTIQKLLGVHKNLSDERAGQLVSALSDESLRSQHFAFNIDDSLDFLTANGRFMKNIEDYLLGLDGNSEDTGTQRHAFSDGCTLSINKSGALSVSVRNPDRENLLKLIDELTQRYNLSSD